MSIIKKPTRFAHSEGHLDICYDDEGRHIITCGTDGDVRIYEGFEDDEPLTHRVGDSAHAIAYKNFRFYTASDDNSIQAFIFKEGQPDGVITRFTAPVTHMCFNNDGSKLLAGSSDFTVRLVDVESSSFNVLTEHEAPVLSVALSPDGSLAASSSCDGTVKICTTTDRKVVKTISGLPKCNDFDYSKTLCRLCWDRQGKSLIVPMEKEIKVFDSTSWELTFTLRDDTMNEFVSIVCLSPCGDYLAASCRDGSIVVFDFNTKICITKEKHEKGLKITGLVWNPKNKHEIAYCDANGNLGLLENVISMSGKNNQQEMTADQLADLFDDNDEDILVEATNPSSNANNFGDSDDDMPTMTPGKRRTTAILDDDDDESREKVLPAADPGKDLFDDFVEGGDSDMTKKYAPKSETPQPRGWWPTTVQPSFQSGSSPDHLSHRYMVWNSVGIVIQYNTDEENSINVEFHDTATHHPIHITNSLGHTMADISSHAVLLACPSDNDSPSKLVCMVLSAWDNSKEWTAVMDEGEEIQAIAVSDSWAAAVTSDRVVRLFSLGGLQQEMFCLSGPVVSMAAHTNQLLLAFHRSMGIPGDQCLGILQMSVVGKKKITLKGDLPLAPKSTLTWLGFSAEGTPFIADSTGIVRMVNRAFGSNWTQVANTKLHTKGKSDNFFIVGIHENPQQLRAVLCRGSRYPPTLPRPTVSLLAFKIPVCELNTDKGMLEETYWRSQLFSQHMDWWETQGYEVDENEKSQLVMPQQESLMKLFALSCKSEREYRAEELCRMMPSHHTVQLAIKYASRLRMLQLAQRLNEVAREKMEEETMKTNTEDDVEDFRTDLEAVHSHVETEWSHLKSTTNKNADVYEKMEDECEEDADEDIEGDADEANIQQPAPVLKLGGRNENAMKKTVSLSQTRKNPFKVASMKNASQGQGASVFDNMEKPKLFGRGTMNNKGPLDKPVTIKRKPKTDVKKSQGINKMFGNTSDGLLDANSEDSENKERSSTTGFQLWYEETQTGLKEEHPDLSDSDLAVLAAKEFKDLPPDEKKSWNYKAKQGTTDTKKRKRDTVDPDDADNKIAKKNESVKKGILSENTTSKLSGFAFEKS